jgi:hypothetical protein
VSIKTRSWFPGDLPIECDQADTELMETSSILVTVVLILAAIALLLYILRRR